MSKMRKNLTQIEARGELSPQRPASEYVEMVSRWRPDDVRWLVLYGTRFSEGLGPAESRNHPESKSHTSAVRHPTGRTRWTLADAERGMEWSPFPESSTFFLVQFAHIE
jgi:hypothetical protein